MEPLGHYAPFTGWVYPNETVIEWSVAIVVYPYITGLVARRRSGLAGTFYRVLTLGSYDLSEEALRCDRKWIFWLAIVGIPGAHGLHGYVGFLFGSLKSRAWWSSGLMPVGFLFSAIIP